MIVILLIQFSSDIYAGSLAYLKDRLNRLIQNQTNGIAHIVVFTTENAVSGGAGNNSVVLVFPDADDTKWCATAGTDLVAIGSTEDSAAALPGTLTARCTQGSGGSNYDTIYVEGVDNLSATTKYGVQVSDGSTAKLGTPAATTTGLITVKTNNGTGDVDNEKLAVDIITNDQVTVTATVPSPYQPPGGGGGGGGIPYEGTSVIFSGRAYPGSTVTLLKDAQIAVKTVAGPDANFYISLSGLTGGNYIFSLYSEDREGRRSSLLSFPVSVTSGATTKVSGIFISPTIAVDKSEVKRGDDIAIFGQSAAQTEITIAVASEEEIFVKTPSDKDGVYLYNFDTSIIDYGSHFTKSKAAFKGEISSFGLAVGFLVGTKNVFAKLAKCPPKADLNNDCRVNLVDFSIAAYWYKRPLSVAFKAVEGEKLNGDGKIDLVDFSIMAYYWTG